MRPTHWPDGTPRSYGNGFDLEKRFARGPSVFCDQNAKHSTAGKKGGENTASPVPVVDGLSERAQKQLKATGVQMSVKSDPVKAQRMRKANI